MQITNFTFKMMLCMSLFVPVAKAEDVSIPDKSHRQGMSYEEYSTYREKMRLQMEKNKSEDLKQKPASSDNPSAQTNKSAQDRAYGKGYHTRNPPVERPAASSRPERPQVERFNRGDMGRR